MKRGFGEMLCSLASEEATLRDGNQMMLLKKPEGCAVQLGMMVQFCFANEFSGRR